MNRLLQGDVGAGKTIVALLAALVAMENGLQVAFMAPTEILAEQHFVNISRLLAAVAVSRRAADRRTTGRRAPRRSSPKSSRARSTSSSARTRWCRSDVAVPAARAGGHRRAAPVRRAAAGDAAREGAASRRAGDDGDADPAHAGADGLRRSRRVGHPRAAAGPPADQDAGEARVAARRDLRVRARAARRRPPGVRDLSAGRGVGEGRSEGGDRDGRPSRAGGVSGVPRRAAARPDEGRTRRIA